MSTFAQKLAAAKAAPRPTADVQILLAADLVAERDRLQEIIDAPVADERLTAASPQDEARAQMKELMESAGDAVITIRLTQLPGVAWTEITSKCPPRPGVAVDEQYSYNYDMASLAAVRHIDEAGRHYGVRIEDGEEVEFVVEKRTPENPNPVDEWGDLIASLSGHEIRNLRNTAWGLNEYLPQIQISSVGKAFGAAGRS